MPKLEFYRYVLLCRPSPSSRRQLAQAAQRAGQRLRPDRYHLTFCVIAEVPERDPSIMARIEREFANGALCSAPILSGRVVGGSLGAQAQTIGKQDELRDLYDHVVRTLARCGFDPLHRKSGFHPHLTLGYDPCCFAPFNIALDWLPDELLLVESEVGLTQHNVLGRWTLLPPRQGTFDFGPEGPTGFDRPPTAAANLARRSAA